METDKFCLKWKNHHDVLVSMLDNLFENHLMCDVTLAAEHQYLKVHRLVLCACSSYFEAMLSQQVDKQAVIFLKDVKFANLRALVEYMYKGEVNITQEQLESFLQTAEDLDVKGLVQKNDSEQVTSRSRVSSSPKRPYEVLSVPPMSSTQKPEDVNSQSPPTRAKGPPPAKKQATHQNSSSNLNDQSTDPEMKEESSTSTQNSNEQDETNGPDWTLRVYDEDCSRSDVDSIAPPSAAPHTSDFRMSEETAGSSFIKLKTNTLFNTSRDASPVVPIMDCSQDTVQAIATAISAVSTPSTVCPRCSARFSRVGAMLVHLRSNECDSLPKFTCPLPSCNFITRHQRNIKRHVVRLHPQLDYS